MKILSEMYVWTRKFQLNFRLLIFTESALVESALSECFRIHRILYFVRLFYIFVLLHFFLNLAVRILTANSVNNIFVFVLF